jgi:hypothetical protein
VYNGTPQGAFPTDNRFWYFNKQNIIAQFIHFMYLKSPAKKAEQSHRPYQTFLPSPRNKCCALYLL